MPIVKVLEESDTPLHYSEITSRVLSRGYYRTDGATPAATVSAQIAASIKHDGLRSPFARVAKGVYSLNQNNQLPLQQEILTPPAIPLVIEQETSESIIQAFGMYRKRDLVVWKNDPKLFGKQQMLASSVDFGKQKGIYILYDHHKVSYVGRATDRPLGKRLFEHTLDRLSGRWDRFSWFGLLNVTQEGNLREMSLNVSLSATVATLEALLIEALEPPQNRKRGDDFSGIEYIQDVDPELKERQIQSTLRAFEQNLRGGQ